MAEGKSVTPVVPAKDASPTGSLKGNSNETNVGVSVPSERGEYVQLCLRLRALRPKRQPAKWFAQLAKPTDPTPLCANAEFVRWRLSANSLHMKVRIRTEKKRPSKTPTATDQQQQQAAATAMPAADDERNWETFELVIAQFPCSVDDESVRFDVVQPSSRDYSFVMIKLKKTDGSTSWQTFMNDHGCLDASLI